MMIITFLMSVIECGMRKTNLHKSSDLVCVCMHVQRYLLTPAFTTSPISIGSSSSTHTAFIFAVLPLSILATPSNNHTRLFGLLFPFPIFLFIFLPPNLIFVVVVVCLFLIC